MSTPGERLNLRPFEKRLVAGVATVLFLVINFWFVFPHFGDWSKFQGRYELSQRKLERYQKEIGQMAANRRKIDGLQDKGADIPLEDQATHFSSTIASQAAQSGVSVPQTGRIKTTTNQFFITQSETISTQSGEPQLVDFLFKLGDGPSPIRVSGLTIRPDVPRQALSANVTLAARYQLKKPLPKPASRTGAAADSANRTRTRP
jgi:hypothetical protein